LAGEKRGFTAETQRIAAKFSSEKLTDPTSSAKMLGWGEKDLMDRKSQSNGMGFLMGYPQAAEKT